MSLDPKLNKILAGIVQRWNAQLVITQITEITPDASSRHYFRLGFNSVIGYPQSVVVMVFNSVAPAEASGRLTVPTDQACVDLIAFLTSYKILVPRLFYDARDQGILLIEDLGDLHLADIALAAQGKSSIEVNGYYQNAIDQILILQSIPQQHGFFIFERQFSEELYLKEMYELRDYLLIGMLTAEELTILESFFVYLAQVLDRFPKVLVHRDFHSWNLLIDQDKNIRVIDFQDALLGTRCYDLVGLLNDRDTDNMLGRECYLKLINYYRQKALPGPDFLDEYDLVLLQRDLKVAGRFAKLSKIKGRGLYQQWIPGTLKRIGSTLTRILNRGSMEGPFSDLLCLLSNKLPEVNKGRSDPLIF